ncbi:1-acyl-sn-glycerol-3-phosphate acyltransferase [Porticoccaceae bacterium LTM1]|nr:1-acyl-sn-glycerol-3-phosphate acyltransferase [Porticoccaceae bacterium LTM1]
MTDFEDIRPYNDAEVRPVLDRLLADSELHDTIAGMKYPRLSKLLPWLFRPLVAKRLKAAFASATDVDSFQKVIGHYWWALIEKQSEEIAVSGLDQLPRGKSYLYICNHRDIAMDPALVGLSLDRAGRKTMRIAIGDNLLSKPFTSDLMRLNKSFIVKRSVSGRREKLQALMQLSSYIRHSITVEQSSIWIAQREGRAKDGLDRTDTALIKMLMLSKPKEQSFAEAAAELNIVPVSLSYELDPCDASKARELYSKKELGSYQKGEHEDLQSIYDGIVGQKGHIHVAFGRPLAGDELESADSVAEAIDRQVLKNYHQHPTNLIAYELLNGNDDRVDALKKVLDLSDEQWSEARVRFEARIAAMPAEHREYAIAIYANPVVSQLELLESKG